MNMCDHQGDGCLFLFEAYYMPSTARDELHVWSFDILKSVVEALSA